MSNSKIVTFKKIVIMLTLITIFSLALSSCKNKSTPYKKTSLAMGTVINQSIYDENAENISQKVTKEINNIENSYLTCKKQGSDVYKINQKSGNYVKVNPLTLKCIKTSIDVSNNCNGIYDVTIGKLSSLWNIGTDSARVPSQDEIDSAIQTINYNEIKLKNDSVKVKKGQALDLGGVGKGAACDSVDKLLTKEKVDSAIISVGGSILLHGKNPNDDGKWSVAIRNPRGNANEYCAVLKLDSCCVSTSGDYERVLVKDNKKYHHILDTKTGYPAKSDIISATVICHSGVLSDALSTVCFINGYEMSLGILKKYDAQAVFIDKDFNVYVTDGLKQSITITNDGFKIVN